MTKITATIETIPTDLKAVNVDILRAWLGYASAVVSATRDLDHAESELRALADRMGLFVYRGGDHLALHMFSGHPARMLMVKESAAGMIGGRVALTRQAAIASASDLGADVVRELREAKGTVTRIVSEAAAVVWVVWDDGTEADYRIDQLELLRR